MFTLVALRVNGHCSNAPDLCVLCCGAIHCKLHPNTFYTGVQCTAEHVNAYTIHCGVLHFEKKGHECFFIHCDALAA